MGNKFIILLVVLFLGSLVFAIPQVVDKNYSGGVYNGDFELGTGSSSIPSGFLIDSNTGVYMSRGSSSNWTVSFDTSIKHSGNQSIFIDTNVGSTANNNFLVIGYGGGTSSTLQVPSLSRYGIPVKSSTKYSVCLWFKSQDYNGGTGTKPFALHLYNSSGIRTSNSSTTTNYDVNTDWTKACVVKTTDATAVYAVIALGNHATGATGKVWVDDVSLEEVGTTTLTGQATGRPQIVVTGVSDFNTIDQADNNNSATAIFGNATRYTTGMCFTPTKNSQKFVFQRSNSTGTFTGDVIITLRDENKLKVNTPLTPVLATVTISNAVWEAIPQTTDYAITLPYTLDANGTNKYCVDFNSTTQDAGNYARLRSDTAVGYSGGAMFYNTGSAYTALSEDLYFKTLFEKQSSAFDLNVCSLGDTRCDFKTYNINLTNGETYTITPSNSPLFYSGDNNVYYMQHSDTDFNNKTPSMLGKLQYTFDTPTTTITQNLNGINNTINLFCTPALAPCLNSYLTVDGQTQTTVPFILSTLQQHTLIYYSIDTIGNLELSNTTIIPQNIATATFNAPTCQSILGGFTSIIAVIILVFVVSLLVLGVGVVLFFAENKNNYGMNVDNSASQILPIVVSAVVVASILIVGIFFIAKLCI